MKYCETCKFYCHRANILGGIAECLRGEKELMTFWRNRACENYQETKEDNLAEQNKYYKEHLGGALRVKS